MRVRAIIIAVSIGAAVLCAAPWLHSHHANEGPPAQSVEPDAQPAVTLTGGRVAAVLAHPGDRVHAGQTLVRLDAAELDAHLAKARETVSSMAIVERVPAETWIKLIGTDPEQLAAEGAYVDALRAVEQHPSSETRNRLRQADERRAKAYRQSATFRPDSLLSMRRESAETLRWISDQRERADVRSPIDGIVEILALSPGDVLPPASPVALIRAEAIPPK